MTRPSTTHDADLLQTLLHYFRQQPLPLKPILHPDQSINRLVSSPELPAMNFRNAAVLIAIHNNAIVLTQRTEHLSSHPGQVSFPGGRAEERDANPIETALRESEEEIGLPGTAVTVLGQLGNLLMPSGFCVTPVVGLIAPGTLLTPCPREVAHIFEVPVSIALNTDSYQRARILVQDTEREVLEFHYDGYRIWGATATMLWHLATELKQQEQ